MVNIRAVAIGIMILSLNLFENSSMIVIKIDVISEKIIDADDNRNIIMYVVIRKDKVPSNDLSNNE